jgi:hypothetical protein
VLGHLDIFLRGGQVRWRQKKTPRAEGQPRRRRG